MNPQSLVKKVNTNVESLYKESSKNYMRSAKRELRKSSNERANKQQKTKDEIDDLEELDGVFVDEKRCNH